MEKLLPALQLKTSSNEMTFKLIMQGKDYMCGGSVFFTQQPHTVFSLQDEFEGHFI